MLASSGLSGLSGLYGSDGAAPAATFRLALEDGSGFLLLEDGSYVLLEGAP